MKTLDMIDPTLEVSGKCAACHGNGMIQNPMWTEFWTATYSLQAERDNPYPWFEERGWIFKGALPPKELTCSECDGNGVLHMAISLDELRELLH
jgi:hypothetical protein